MAVKVDVVKFSIENGYPPIVFNPPSVWRNLSVVRYLFNDQEIEQPSHRQTVITLNLSGPAYVERSQAGKTEAAIWPTGAVGIYPPDMPARWRFPKLSTVLHLALEPVLISEAARGVGLAPARVEVLNRINLSDKAVESFGLLLNQDIESGCANGSLYGECLATALAVYLLTHHAAFPVRLKEYVHGLGKSDLSRVLSCIGDHLAEDLSLDELAACCHLSPYHFCRLFRQSTGQSPHQYVISQRVEKAKSLLMRGGLTVGEVAQVVGFSDHSKLHHHFKKLTGLTPGQYSKK